MVVVEVVLEILHTVESDGNDDDIVNVGVLLVSSGDISTDLLLILIIDASNVCLPSSNLIVHFVALER